MNKAKLLEIFNTNLLKFTEDLQKICPEELTFRKASAILTTAWMLDKERPLGEFMRYCAPFENQIMKKEDSFFLTTNLDSNKMSDKSMGIITKLRNLWLVITDENKEKIWKWMHFLYKAGSKYIYM